MSKLTLELNGTRIGRSSLALKTQEYLTQLESDLVRLEGQLWQLVELRPQLKKSYCDQWCAMIRRLESDAATKTGLTVSIETPSWVLLMSEGKPVQVCTTKKEP
jgi:hypothetical protein